MESSGRRVSLLIWAALAALLSQNLVIPVIATASFEDQKTYYSPDPHARTPPQAPHKAPPSHRTPSHGGAPPANCGNPPSGGHHKPTPSPPKGGGGGGYYPSPSTPTVVSPPSTPTYVSPPTTPIVSPPTTPIVDPGTPSTPTIGTPTIPIITPGTPSIPGISIPSPPFDPNSPPFTCDYWRTHPGLIWGIFGWWGTVGGAFGVASVPGFGSHMNLLQALSNTRTDALGELYRQGTASLLNSMASKRFTYTTRQVKDSFVAALSSNSAAAAQAHLFKLANEGRLKIRA